LENDNGGFEFFAVFGYLPLNFFFSLRIVFFFSCVIQLNCEGDWKIVKHL